jgi:glycosyltransferase involved in cell wall biosynthesis
MPTFHFPLIALLGRQDMPTDGVRDYCTQLGTAFARAGEQLDIAEVRWESHGWVKALAQFWKESRGWKGRWILFQYTALMWSRRGFPIGALAVLWILRLRGTRLCVVFHDVRYDSPGDWKQRIRVPFQYRTMRAAFRCAARCVLTVPLAQVPWLPKDSSKSAFIPVGSNFPEGSQQTEDLKEKQHGVPTIVVFGVTGGAGTNKESADISFVIRHLISKIPRVRLMVIGRGSSEAEATLRKALDGSGVELFVLGVLPPKQLREILTEADVMLCVRGHVSSRRGSAIAGIACGLPIVGYRGEETAFPITEAGVLLVDGGDQDGVASALCRVLTDDKLRGELRQRSLDAERQYFSWDAIAAQFLRILSEN